MKRCSTCKEMKPLEAFGFRLDSKDRHKGRCKKCCNGSHWPAAARASFHAIPDAAMQDLPIVWPAPIDGGREDLRR